MDGRDAGTQSPPNSLLAVSRQYDDQVHRLQQCLAVIRQLDARLEEGKVIGNAEKDKSLDHPLSLTFVIHWKGPGIFQDAPPAQKEMVLSGVAQKKHP
jgi:hypothetical protein